MTRKHKQFRFPAFFEVHAFNKRQALKDAKDFAANNGGWVSVRLDTTPPDTVVIAEMNSETRSWIAVGRTEEEAMAALQKRWYDEAKLWRLSEENRNLNLQEYYGVRFTTIRPGQTCVDGEEVK